MQPCVTLADLFMVAVQVAHHRLKRFNRFAVKRHHHAEHAVRARMMRTQIHHKAICLELVLAVERLNIHTKPHTTVQRLLRGIAQPRKVEIGGILDVFAVDVEFFRTAGITFGPAALKRLVFFLVVRLFPVLTHGMTVKAFPQQNALQVWMTGKANAIQVVCFTLLKVYAGPDVDQRWDFGVFTRRLRLEDQRGTATGAIRMVDHLHAVFDAEIVHRRRAGEIIETKFLLDGGCDLDQMVAIYDDATVALPRIILHPFRKALLEDANGSLY